MMMAPDTIRTPDFIRASLLRALGARLVGFDTASNGGRMVVVLDVSGVLDSLTHNVECLVRELRAAANADCAESAANAVIDNSLLSQISGHHSDLKRRA